MPHVRRAFTECAEKNMGIDDWRVEQRCCMVRTVFDLSTIQAVWNIRGIPEIHIDLKQKMTLSQHRRNLMVWLGVAEIR